MPQTVKKLSCLLLILTAAVTLHAQNDDRAFAAAVDSIISDKTLDYIVVDRIVDEIFEKHGKSAYLAYRIAKSYYQYVDVTENSQKVRKFAKNDTARAFKYIHKSIEINPKYPEPYILGSDILRFGKGVDAALAWLEKGIEQNPAEPSFYITQAKLLALKDPIAAEERLMAIKKNNPEFNVNLELGRMYLLIDDHGGTKEERLLNIAKIAEAFENVNLDVMTAQDLSAYAMSLQTIENFGREQEVASYGIKKFPDNFELRMYLFYSLWALNDIGSIKDWPAAVDAAEKLFALGDTTKIEYLHYYRYGMCLRGAKRFDDAIALFEKIMEMDIATEKLKRQTERTIALTISAKASDCVNRGEYEEALEVLRPYLEKYKSKGKQNDNLLLAYARIYRDWGNTLESGEKEEKYANSSKIYTDAIPGSQLNKSTFARENYEMMVKLDSYAQNGSAVSAAEQYTTALEYDMQEDPNLRVLLQYPWVYLREYYINKKDNAMAVEYAKKILEINKSDERSQKIVDVLGPKIKNRRRK